MTDDPQADSLSDEVVNEEALAHSGEEGGESAGTDDPFFHSRKAAAVFKHKLLRTYFPKFAGKAAAYEADHRLVYVDTHAGRGAYNDGEPGSPLLVAQSAAGMTQRQTDCIFIEKDRGNYQRLAEVLTEQVGESIKWEAWHGSASDHLQRAVTHAGDAPLFVFIDPYGLGPTFDEVVAVLNRPRRGYGSKTEVLLNFISGAFGRAGAYLRFEQPNEQQITTLAHLDAVLGGDWWREVYLSAASPSDAVAAIGRGYAVRIKARTQCIWSMIPVKNRAHHLPLYWLVHFTRHPDGQWWIREAAAQASAEWRRYLAPPPEADDGGLFTPEELDPFPDEERRRQEQWVAQIAENGRAVLTEQPQISVRADVRKLLGDDLLGLAWEKHLRHGLLRLHEAALLEPKPMSKDFVKYVGRRTWD